LDQVSNIFSQLLGLAPRRLFDAAVARHDGMRLARGFSCWDQFVAMLFCQLGQAHSLREIREGLQACEEANWCIWAWPRHAVTPRSPMPRLCTRVVLGSLTNSEH